MFMCLLYRENSKCVLDLVFSWEEILGSGWVVFWLKSSYILRSPDTDGELQPTQFVLQNNGNPYDFDKCSE